MIIKITDSGLSEKEAFALIEKTYREIMEMQLKRVNPEAYKFLKEGFNQEKDDD